MNVVDSSGWLEYLADGPNAAFFGPPLRDTARLVVPSICLYEVFRRVLTQRTEDEALRAVALLHRGRVIPLSGPLALSAARLGKAHGLPMADSVILATAKDQGATLWTQDADFEGMDGVRFVAARRS